MLGELVKHHRTQIGLTQEALAEEVGITASTLSRIERGITYPETKILLKMFDKLGISHINVSDMLMTKEMAKYQAMMDELDNCLSRCKADEAIKIIAQLRMDKQFMSDDDNKQYITAAEAVVAVDRNECPERIIASLQDAMRKNGRDFDENNLKKYVLGQNDFRVLNMLAIYYHETEKTNAAISILNALIEYIEERIIDKMVRGQRYPQTAYNLARFLQQAGRYYDAIDVCERGKKVCISTSRFKFLPLLNLEKAKCFVEIGNRDDAIVLLREVYHASSMFEDNDSKNDVKKYIEERLPGIVLTMW